MSAKDQKTVFTFAVVFMFGAFLSSVRYCPPPLDWERHLVFLLGVAETLIPAFLFLFAARRLSEVR